MNSSIGTSYPEQAVLTKLDERVPATFDTEAQFKLVDPKYLSECYAKPELFRNLVVLEAHFSSVDHPLDLETPAFRHIPGAIQVHPSYLEAGLNREKYYPFYDHPTDANVMSGSELGQALEGLGVTPDSRVVVYGSDPDGVMAAARLVWGLMYAGVRCVRLLDGGIDAWVAHGGVTDFKIESVWDANDDGSCGVSEWCMRREYLATSLEVQSFVKADKSPLREKLIDVRTEAEWNGTARKKYPFFSRVGHIPGALHQGNWDNLMTGSSRSLGRHLDVVESRWREQGIIDRGVEDGATALVFYCGTGWRSSIAFLVAHLLGFQAKNYDDGFYGWSHCPENEIILKDGSP